MADRKSGAGTVHFAVTSAANSVKLDGRRTGRAAFTVTSPYGQPLATRARVKPSEETDPAWFSIEGNAERPLRPGGTEQYTVRIAVPESAPPGSHQFQLVIAALTNPDDYNGEGPSIAFEVPARAPAGPPFPWWIPAAIAAGVLLLLIVGLLLWHPWAAPTPTPSPTPQLSRAERYRQAVMADAPAVYYQLGETTETSAHDSSGHGLDAPLKGTTPISGVGAPAPSGVAQQFDGRTSEVDARYVQFDATAYTIEAWVNTTVTAPNQVIANDRGAGGKSLTLGLNGYSALSFAMDTDYIYVGVTAATVSIGDGRWHYVVGTWSAPRGTPVAPGQFALYVDGQAIATNPTIVNGPVSSPLTGNGPTKIGRHDAWNTWFNGAIEEVAIYTTALPANRVLAHYQAATAP